MTGMFNGPLTGDVRDVARRLLGCELIAGDVRVRLTEVEAYDGSNDPGSHAFRGQTPRNAVMFGPPGRLYVYFIYGMYHCMNYVTGDDGVAAAVLLRAATVVDGVDIARSRRGRSLDRNLSRGPARLCQALGISLQDNGVELHDSSSPVRLKLGAQVAAGCIRSGPRVGISGVGGSGVVYPWRFWIVGKPTVSVYRPATTTHRP